MWGKRRLRTDSRRLSAKKGKFAIIARGLASIVAGFFYLAGYTAIGAEPNGQKADRVVVMKEKRTLLLMQEDSVLYTFDIVLGGAPEGDKLEEGDWRTPEGRYVIDWRNAQSRFYKSLHISYPSPTDRLESAAEDVDPGGMIMIHGYPPGAIKNPAKYKGQDWTDGCIALQNKDMDIVWSVVEDGIPIEILP